MHFGEGDEQGWFVGFFELCNHCGLTVGWIKYRLAVINVFKLWQVLEINILRNTMRNRKLAMTETETQRLLTKKHLIVI
ncbi:hypothetical protein Syncc8109_2058 [Synechococcus sp. WH 8109]|nr:hypothetical protein Syncc8109_2058 [Synechococcus sp. WH 8109]